MTIAPAFTETTYALAGGALGPYSTVWPYAEDSDVQVILDVRDGQGGKLLTLNVDYTLADNGALPNAGKVTMTGLQLVGGLWPAGSVLTLLRATPRSQSAAIGEMAGFSPKSVENALDNVDRQIQELSTAAGRALTVPYGETAQALPRAADRANKALMFDASGKVVAQLLDIQITSDPTVFETLTLFENANVPTNVHFVQTAGFAAAGDGGAAPLKASTGPAAPGKWQSADGGWWALATPNPNILMFGAVGDGDHAKAAANTAAIQAALDFCLGPAAAPHGTNFYLNLPNFFPAGHFITNGPLQLTNVQGARLSGASRFGTTVENIGAGSVFQTNGCEYSIFENMWLKCADATACCFDLDWTGAGVALQSNTFRDMYFSGGGYGVRIGASGHQGSENSFFNCFWDSSAIAGLATLNYNSLQNTIWGGNMQGCAIGVWMHAGTCCVYSCGFQLSTSFDIKIDNSANDAVTVTGCRTESTNFISMTNGMCLTVVACSQTSATDGWFVQGGGPLTLISCHSIAGYISNSRFSATVRMGCSFRQDAYHNPAGIMFGAMTDLDTQPTNVYNGSSQVIGETVNTVGNGVVTGNGVMLGLFLRGGAQGAGFTDTTDTAANILAPANAGRGPSHIQGQVLRFRYVNTTTQIATLAAGAGVTLVPAAPTIAPGASADFMCVITNATTPTITIYG